MMRSERIKRIEVMNNEYPYPANCGDIDFLLSVVKKLLGALEKIKEIEKSAPNDDIFVTVMDALSDDEDEG